MTWGVYVYFEDFSKVREDNDEGWGYCYFHLLKFILYCLSTWNYLFVRNLNNIIIILSYFTYEVFVIPCKS